MLRCASVFLILFLALPLAARAERYSNAGHVVHTRRAPVIAHRLVPPFHGVHTYESNRGRR